jgi:hypothetical protein
MIQTLGANRRRADFPHRDDRRRDAQRLGVIQRCHRPGDRRRILVDRLASEGFRSSAESLDDERPSD